MRDIARTSFFIATAAYILGLILAYCLGGDEPGSLSTGETVKFTAAIAGTWGYVSAVAWFVADSQE